MTKLRVALMVVALVLFGVPGRQTVHAKTQWDCGFAYQLNGYDAFDNLVGQLENSHDYVPGASSANACQFYGTVWGGDWADAACAAHGFTRVELHSGTWFWMGPGYPTGTLGGGSGYC